MPSTDLVSKNELVLKGGNLVYSFGGAHPGGFIGTVHTFVYDLTTDTWTPLAPLSYHRHSATAGVVSEDEILIVGKELVSGIERITLLLYIPGNRRCCWYLHHT